MAASPMLLGTYDPEVFAKHRYMFVSEKYDGWRLYFRNGTFYTRRGNPLVLPTEFAEALAPFTGLEFDGELWMGYGSTSTDIAGFNPATVRYMIFDIPNAAKTFKERYTILRSLFINHPRIHIVKHFACETPYAVEFIYNQVLLRGGEGVVLRAPKQTYKHGARDPQFMKKKPAETLEALVQGYYTKDATKKPVGYVSSICVQSLDGQGHEFKVSVKSSSPPPIGSIVTIQYSQRTSTGLPKFTVLVGVREGADLPTDLVLPKPTKKTVPNDFKFTGGAVEELKRNRFCQGTYTAKETGAFELSSGKHCYLENGRGQYYKINRSRDGVIYYCSCEAWRYQHLPPMFRTCKHCIAIGNFQPKVPAAVAAAAEQRKALRSS